MMRNWSWYVVCAASLAALGCGDGAGLARTPDEDGGATANDGGSPDADSSDAGSLDSGSPDAGFAASLSVQHVEASPGEIVAFEVSTHQPDAVGVDFDLIYDAERTPLMVATEQEGVVYADCELLVDLGSDVIVSFRLMDNPSRLRAFVHSGFDLASLPAGPLFRCNAAISAQAPVGDYPLLIDDPLMSDADGQAIELSVDHGAIAVR